MKYKNSQDKQCTKFKLRKEDEVIVIAGKDKGRTGKILKVLLKNGRVLVEKINLMKKHVKANPQKNEQGGIIAREATIHVSNVAIYNPRTKKADRIRMKFLDNGKKVRTFVSDGEQIDSL